jgi:hypothetical protein
VQSSTVERITLQTGVNAEGSGVEVFKARVRNYISNFSSTHQGDWTHGRARRGPR